MKKLLLCVLVLITTSAYNAELIKDPISLIPGFKISGAISSTQLQVWTGAISGVCLAGATTLLVNECLNRVSLNETRNGRWARNSAYALTIASSLAAYKCRLGTAFSIANTSAGLFLAWLIP